MRRREAGVDHPQRIEHPLTEEHVERLAGGPGDQHAEHVGAGVVEPPLAGLVQEGQRRQAPHPLVGLGWRLRFRRTPAEAEVAHRLQQRLRPRRLEVHAPAELEREDVVHGDRTLRGDRLAVHRPAWLDEDAPPGELGQEIVDWILEPEPALLDEDQRADGGDRLGHRGDAEDAVALNRLIAAAGQTAGEAHLDVVISGGQPGHAADRVALDVAGHDVVQARQSFRIEATHGRTDRSGREKSSREREEARAAARSVCASMPVPMRASDANHRAPKRWRDSIDLDWLTWFETPDLDDDSSERIFLENLACVVGNYLRAGVRHFVLAGAVRDRRALDHMAASIPVPLRVVRLDVPIDVIERRLEADPTDGRRDDLRVASTWLAAGTGAGVEDITISNEQPIATVGAAIIDWLGWPLR